MRMTAHYFPSPSAAGTSALLNAGDANAARVHLPTPLSLMGRSGCADRLWPTLAMLACRWWRTCLKWKA
jgi:hypothetical protein